MAFNRRAWARKPPPGVPLASGLFAPNILCLPFNELIPGPYQNYALGGRPLRISSTTTNKAAPSAGTVSRVEGPNGPMASITTITTKINCGFEEYATDNANTTSNALNTIICGIRKRDATKRDAAWFGLSTGNNAERYDVQTTTGGDVQWDFGGQDATHRLQASSLSFTAGLLEIWAFTAGTRGQEIWRNGVLIASNASTAITRTVNTTETYEFNLGPGGGNSNTDLIDYDFFYIWNRQLPASLIQYISQRPYSVFADFKPRLFPATAGATQTVTPTGIASAEAFGAPVVAGPIIVSGIASAEAFGLAALVGGPQTIEPGGIFDEAFGNPTVAGPLIVGGIASAEAFGTPLVNLQQAVLPDGIASEEAFGLPYVSNVQSVLPSGIASGEAFGTAVVTGGPQGIIPTGIYEGAVGTPAVIGGAEDLQVYIGTYPRTEWLRSRGVRLQSQTRGRWTAYLEFENIRGADYDTVDTADEWGPLIGQTAIIREYQKWFMGCLTEVEKVRSDNTDFVVYRCSAADKTSICDRRVVPPQVFAADMDAADLIRFINDQYLFGEGITTSEVPVSLGPLGAELTPNYWYVTQVFDNIADLIGMQWFIDVDGRLIWVDPDFAEAAPFNISEISLNYRDIVVKDTLTEYRNKQWVVSNRNVLPGDGTGIQQPPAIDETIMLPQQAAIDRGFVFGALVLQQPVLSVVIFKINGVDTPIYEVTAATFGTLPDLNTVWWFFPGGPYITPPVSGAGIPNPGDVVTISYIPYSNTGAQQNDGPLTVVVPTVPIPGELYGTCGTGIFEHVQYVNDVTSQDDLLAIAQGLLDRSGIVPVIVDFETDYPGLYVGMKLNADIARLGLDNVEVFITALTMEAQAVDLGHGSCFRTRVTAMNVKDVAHWTKYIERLLRRSQFALPVSVATAATFVFAPGTSLSGGTSVENPHPVLASGRLYEIVVMTDNPPTDQDLYIEITRNGTSILSPAFPLIVPDGDDTTVILRQFAGTALYLLKDDRLRATATYRSTGPNPVNARSVTVQVRVAV